MDDEPEYSEWRNIAALFGNLVAFLLIVGGLIGCLVYLVLDFTTGPPLVITPASVVLGLVVGYFVNKLSDR